MNDPTKQPLEAARKDDRMSIKLKLQQMNQQELDAAMRRYAEILEGEIEPGEVAELKELAFALDKTAADVERDHQIIRQIEAAKASIKAARDVDLPLKRAEEALAAYDADTKRLADQRLANRAPLANEANRLDGVKAAAHAAVTTINQIRNENPALLAHEAEAAL